MTKKQPTEKAKKASKAVKKAIPLAQVRAAAAAKAADSKKKKNTSERMAAPVRKQESKAKPKATLAKKIVATITDRVAEHAERVKLTPPILPKPIKKPVRLGAADLKAFKSELMYMRGRLTDKVKRHSHSSLKREDENIRGEEGTEAFERFFALENTGNDLEIIYHIDEALKAIKDGNYGVCKECGSLIQKPRLQALPFAKLCIRCQALNEHRSKKEKMPTSSHRPPDV